METRILLAIYIFSGGLKQSMLTHWGRVTHVSVSKLTVIGSDNGLSPDRWQAIIWTNAGLLLIGPMGIKSSEFLIAIKAFLFKKMRLKMPSAKRRPFCLELNVLRHQLLYLCHDIRKITNIKTARWMVSTEAGFMTLKSCVITTIFFLVPKWYRKRTPQHYISTETWIKFSIHASHIAIILSALMCSLKRIRVSMLCPWHQHINTHRGREKLAAISKTTLCQSHRLLNVQIVC